MGVSDPMSPSSEAAAAAAALRIERPRRLGLLLILAEGEVGEAE
jgi:hypothetical protein